MAMLEGVRDLTLPMLNEATCAWMEMEYQRDIHSEIGQAPLRRFLDGKSVSRPSPSSDELRLAFMTEESRTQRRSDGTISVEGVRFEIPSRYRHLERVAIRYAGWDLGHVVLVDQRTDVLLYRIYPIDKTKNADAHRRSLEAIAQSGAPRHRRQEGTRRGGHGATAEQAGGRILGDGAAARVRAQGRGWNGQRQ